MYMSQDKPIGWWAQNLHRTLEDAWDAVIACLTAYLARHDLEQPFRLHPGEREAFEHEGWIYRAPDAVG